MKPLQLALAAGLVFAGLLARADERDDGRKLFMSGTAPSCSVCHTLRDAQSTGEIGPVLDELQPDAERVAKAVRMGVGVMPAFGEKLSAKEIDLLARYVSKATGASR